MGQQESDIELGSVMDDDKGRRIETNPHPAVLQRGEGRGNSGSGREGAREEVKEEEVHRKKRPILVRKKIIYQN